MLETRNYLTDEALGGVLKALLYIEIDETDMDYFDGFEYGEFCYPPDIQNSSECIKAASRALSRIQWAMTMDRAEFFPHHTIDIGSQFSQTYNGEWIKPYEFGYIAMLSATSGDVSLSNYTPMNCWHESYLARNLPFILCDARSPFTIEAERICGIA